MKSVILVKINKSQGEVIPFATIKYLCSVKKWSYNYIKTKKFPFVYKGYHVDRQFVQRETEA